MKIIIPKIKIFYVPFTIEYLIDILWATLVVVSGKIHNSQFTIHNSQLNIELIFCEQYWWWFLQRFDFFHFFSFHCGSSLLKQFIYYLYNSFCLEVKIFIPRIKLLYLPFTNEYLADIFLSNIGGGFWKDLIFFNLFAQLWFLLVVDVDLSFFMILFV